MVVAEHLAAGVSKRRCRGIPLARFRLEPWQSIRSKGLVMAAEKNACSRIDEFGGKAKEGLGQRIRDKGVEYQGKLDQAESRGTDAVHKMRDALK